MAPWALVRAVSDPLVETLHRVVLQIPGSSESTSQDPQLRSRVIARIAAGKAAAISAGLALPPGPAGFLTVIPDLVLLWRLQGQMVSDIAAAHGKTAFLTQEGMMYCLFKHGVAQAFRSIVVVGGGRLLLRRASVEAIQSLLRKVGVELSERVALRGVSRWLPVIGAMGAGAFAYYDTSKIARTAMDVFASELALDDPPAQASA